ncbi:hypothetical protein CAPTEDRAFT_212871 [Capitella teleta]|uniref:Uncharacterized protein n=1 Tax=Capitella teleta TaxID=283909 RepID=R7UXE1_CAPTE|nr:hypothetical protein CAPTEDRAFT_212871 [Capitella teleta]|eukprot:ELU11243.1 hypothetical protein CAPTEDRAFT_212871 [Capitella teleta]
MSVSATDTPVNTNWSCFVERLFSSLWKFGEKWCLYRSGCATIFFNGARQYFMEESVSKVFHACPAIDILQGMRAILVSIKGFGEAQEHTVWMNDLLQSHHCIPSTDLRRSIADGLTLVNLVEILSK